MKSRLSTISITAFSGSLCDPLFMLLRIPLPMALDRIRHDGFERLMALTPQAFLDAIQRVEQTGSKGVEPVRAVIDVELV